MDMMKDALSRRRSKGMELQILLDGEPVMQGTAQKLEPGSELAPPPAAEAEMAEEPQGEAPVQEEAVQGSEGPAEAGMGERKPRSLGERARMMAPQMKK